MESAMDAGEGLIAQFVHWISGRMRMADEVAYLSCGDIAELAHDIGVTEADLREVLPRAADNSPLMDAMIRAHGLDPEKVAALSATLMRDLELTCTRCGKVGRCRQELAAGTAAEHCGEFCGNADTFAALKKDVARD